MSLFDLLHKANYFVPNYSFKYFTQLTCKAARSIILDAVLR